MRRRTRAVVAGLLVTACLTGCGQSPAAAAYAKHLSATCRRLLTPALTARIKQIARTYPNLANRENQLLGVTIPYDTQLVAIVPPPGDGAGQNLRTALKRFIALGDQYQADLPIGGLAGASATQPASDLARLRQLGAIVLEDITKVGAKGCEPA